MSATIEEQTTPIEQEFVKLMRTCEVITSKQAKSESPKKEWKCFDLKTDGEFKVVKKEFEDLENKISLGWITGSFEEFVKNNDLKVSFPEDRRKAVARLSEIYKLALQNAETELLDENVRSYPEILLLKIVKIVNYLREDPRYQKQIAVLEQSLEKVKNKGNVPEKEARKQMVDTPFGRIDLNGLMSQIPGLAGKDLKNIDPRKIAESIGANTNNNKVNKIGEAVSKLMSTGAPAKLMNGDFAGFAEELINNEEVVEGIKSFEPELNPAIQKLAGVFNKDANPENTPTLSTFIERAKEEIEKSKDQSEEALEEAMEEYLALEDKAEEPTAE